MAAILLFVVLVTIQPDNDPDVDKLRARRAYEKAGFRGDPVVESGEGPAILMIFDG